MKRKIIVNNKEFTMPKMSIDTYTEYLELAEVIDAKQRYSKQDIEASIVEVEQVEKEASAFDDYDRENGYEDEDEQPEENQWKVCGEIVDRVVKIAIRLLKNSYSQCMKENIVTLLDYLKFELDTINENQ